MATACCIARSGVVETPLCCLASFGVFGAFESFEGFVKLAGFVGFEVFTPLLWMLMALVDFDLVALLTGERRLVAVAARTLNVRGSGLDLFA